MVWHGLSKKLVFASFAAYFDCPTSTTTQRNVAQTFSASSDGGGIILKLKSKFVSKCAFMLDVSTFSDFTDECERLFLGESLIIADILMVMDQRWGSCRQYIAACLYFEKITTGNAGDASWNIAEGPKVQNTQARIIVDYMATRNKIGTATNSSIPDYVRVLFGYYCASTIIPMFDGIDQVQWTMTRKLQQHIFNRIVVSKEQFKDDGKQKISQLKVSLLFPCSTRYINDQKQSILMDAPTSQPMALLKSSVSGSVSITPNSETRLLK